LSTLLTVFLGDCIIFGNYGIGYGVSQLRILECRSHRTVTRFRKGVGLTNSMQFFGVRIFSKGSGLWAYGYDTETGLQDATKEGWVRPAKQKGD
jgi:hypothetical protein